MKKLFVFSLLFMFSGFLVLQAQKSQRPANIVVPNELALKSKLYDFAMVKLTTDTTKLTAKEKQMIPILIRVSKIMDDLFWQQVIGERKIIVGNRKSRSEQRLLEINYGPWERLNGNKPFIAEFGEKPKGANFYPADMTKMEFEKFPDKLKTNPYTILRRDETKNLMCVWYHDAYGDRIKMASKLLLNASELAEDPGLKRYLTLRAEALLTDDYFTSDMAWMEMKNNTIDFVVGPIENYEDELYGYKTAYEAAILVKDKVWSKNLAHFAELFPELQNQLPVDKRYKKEIPASGSDLNAYDLIFAAGHTNAGGKTIAINLPNDEKVQELKGSRRLQLKNVMQAKFDLILVPISKVLIDSIQLGNIRFEAFFANVMFHEVAHGLGIKNTISGKGTVREALKETYSAIEEAKADILGLYLATKLIEMKEMENLTEEDCFITFMAGIIRSVRFGASDSHGKANMMCFNYFEDKGGFERSEKGHYKVNTDKFRTAMNEWAAKILIMEGDGDYNGAVEYIKNNSKIRSTLQSDLTRLKSSRIPVDIIYDQGLKVLGLSAGMETPKK